MKRNILLVNILLILALLLGSTSVYAWSWEEAAEPYRGETINVVMQSHPITEITGGMLDEFTALTGIKVKREEIARNSLLQKQEIELASMTGAYDVMYIHPEVVYRYSKAGWAFPLNQFISNTNLTAPDYEYSDFLKSTREGFQVDGKILGIPFNAESTALYYRKDIFEKYGVQPPKTWAELEEVAQKIGTTEIPAFATRGARGPNIFTFAGFLWSYGGKWVTEDNEPALDSKEAIRALEMYKRLQEFGPLGVANYTHYDVYTDFMQGKLAMCFDATVWGPSFFANPETSKIIGLWDVSMIPAGPAGRFPAYATHGLMISKDSRKKEAAWLFIQWFTSKSTQTKIMSQGAADQPRNSVLESLEYKEKFNYGNWITVNQQSILLSKPDYRPTFLTRWAEVKDIVSIAVQNALVGEGTPESLMKEANDKARKVLQR